MPQISLTQITPHQARVKKSLEKLNVPDWFRPSPEPHTKAPYTPRWSREQSNRPGWRRESSITSISTTPPGYSSRATSTSRDHSTRSSPFPSHPSYHSRWSTSRLNHTSGKDSSLPPPSPSLSIHSSVTSHTYKQPYLGWRSQEQLTITTPEYLHTPAQRLAHSTIRTQPSLPRQPRVKSVAAARDDTKNIMAAGDDVCKTAKAMARHTSERQQNTKGSVQGNNLYRPTQ